MLSDKDAGVFVAVTRAGCQVLVVYIYRRASEPIGTVISAVSALNHQGRSPTRSLLRFLRPVHCWEPKHAEVRLDERFACPGWQKILR
jgi:hypothetical protein